MSRGFLVYAYNNEQIDYGEIALANALMIRANSSEPNVTLVTDKGTMDWLKKNHDEDFINSVFDRIHVSASFKSDQSRRFLDTPSTTRNLAWRNGNRVHAHGMSPYDETIVVDADYLILDRTLDHCWGSREPVMMNRHAITLEHLPVAPEEQRLEPMGVPMYWATCIYFRKSDLSRRLFDMAQHVVLNHDYYRSLYRLPGNLFRNDYVFSIAAHVIGGWSEGAIPSLPCPTLLTSFDCDELIDVPERNQLLFLVNDSTKRSHFNLARISSNVHVMNKFSLARQAKKIIEVYR